MRTDVDEPGGKERGRFVWPPRRLEGTPTTQPASEKLPADFSPRLIPVADEPPEPDPVPEPTAAPALPVQHPGWRRTIHEIERVWLGQVTPPLAVRIAEAGWMPDDAASYCGRCGMTVGPHEGGGGGCPACGARRIGCERIVRLGEFQDLLREVVLEIKFTRWRRLGTQIGAMLGEALRAELEGGRVAMDRVLLVPVPTSFRRRMQRGIDHPLVIARGMAGVTGLPIVRALERRHRPMQQSLPASQRAANLVGAIRVKRWGGERLLGRHIVLVDDVSTTGATLRVAARAIRDAVRGAEARQDPAAGGPARASGVRIWAAVLAVTPEGGRGPG